MNEAISQEMRLYDADGERLYLNAQERKRYLDAVRAESHIKARLYCELLHYSGARPSELRELSIGSLELDNQTVKLRSLKKRKKTRSGKIKLPQYRSIPIPKSLMDNFAVLFDARRRQEKGDNKSLLWPSPQNPQMPVDARTAYRWVKNQMDVAKITGKKASAKGLRHGFAVHLVLKKIPITKVQKYLGHTSITTTEFYLQVLGEEEIEMMQGVWDD